MQDILAKPISLSISSTPAHLPIVRAVVERLTQRLGFDEESGHKITLAVDEALSNIIKHAYHGQDDQPIEVTFRCVHEGPGREALGIELRDWGTPVPRDQIRSRDLEDVRPGGLGVHIITSIMDDVKYIPSPGGGTRLRMTKGL
ncbi:MAG: ATP-binding protein [Planctomycetota bacterium]|jgi:anti-sigma regulatory factor (Ser/Thr protein kinase)